MIDRNSDDFEQQKNNAVYAGSYLAKTRSKEHKPKGARVSSSSIIKENDDARCGDSDILQASRISRYARRASWHGMC